MVRLGYAVDGCLYFDILYLKMPSCGRIDAAMKDGKPAGEGCWSSTEMIPGDLIEALARRAWFHKDIKKLDISSKCNLLRKETALL